MVFARHATFLCLSFSPCKMVRMINTPYLTGVIGEQINISIGFSMGEMQHKFLFLITEKTPLAQTRYMCISVYHVKCPAFCPSSLLHEYPRETLSKAALLMWTMKNFNRKRMSFLALCKPEEESLPIPNAASLRTCLLAGPQCSEHRTAQGRLKH